jgi:hypothetical protein
MAPALPPGFLLYRKESCLITHQSFTPVVIGVTGASLATLVAIIYAQGQRPPEPGRPVKFTTENITRHFIASLPELPPN